MDKKETFNCRLQLQSRKLNLKIHSLNDVTVEWVGHLKERREEEEGGTFLIFCSKTYWQGRKRVIHSNTWRNCRSKSHSVKDRIVPSSNTHHHSKKKTENAADSLFRMYCSVRTHATADDLPGGAHGHDSDLRGRAHGLEAALEPGRSNGSQAWGRQWRGQVLGGRWEPPARLGGSGSGRQVAATQNAPVCGNWSRLAAPVRISTGESLFFAICCFF